ncbi:MAG: class I SAM-dependent methyltransferase [Pseudomonadota bacterium]
MGLASWWLPLQIALPFALASSLLLEVPAWSYLAVFTILLLVFWNAAGERVPLYLSNATTCRALGDLLPQGRSFAFIDLGCGLGGVLTRLAKNRKGRFFGIETAPLPFVFSWLRALLFDRKRLAIYRASLWDQDLSQFDVVYCFLSPEPMPTLFEKAKAEMKPGSLFISNSFRVPDYPADKILTLGDRRATQLHIWRF